MNITAISALNKQKNCIYFCKIVQKKGGKDIKYC